MKRRQLLAGIGISAVGPSINSKINTKEIGPVLFTQADLTYDIESKPDVDLQGYHIDHPPEFIFQKQDFRMMNYAMDETIKLIKNKESVINFRGIQELSDSIPNRRKRMILPAESGNRNQLSFGWALNDKIRLPDFGVQKIGPKAIQISAFGQRVDLNPSETTTLIGDSADLTAKVYDSDDSAEITVRPTLSVSNHGVLKPIMKV